MKRLLSGFICCYCFATWALGQITFSPPSLNFSTVFQGAPSPANITLTNNTSSDLVVEDIHFYHSEAFSLQDTAFTIAAGGSRTLTITCDPHQNVNYADWLLVKTSSHPVVPSASLFAIGKYADAYYDATQNLWNEDLKTALKTTITTGMILINSYNTSRDQMYMVIDNQRINGQGAAQNTLECIYTGFLAVGYTNRTDAQTTFNLNTEHTMPQSLFNSHLPELSDLHHIFVTTAPANTERGNNAFGTVTNPSWSQGGSKSNGTLFEPRDEQKGPSIRALLYFLFRYQDYQGFICGMQTTLRDWHRQYPPDSIEKKRNDDIFAFQHNRNPFVDHPEFMDRIASLCSVDNGNPSPISEWVNDSLNFGSIPNGNSLDGYYAVANQGIDTLHLTNLAISSPEFSLLGASIVAIPKDSIAIIPIRFTPSGSGQNFTAQLSFNMDDPSVATRTVYLSGNSIVLGNQEPNFVSGIKVWPQPASKNVWIEFPTPLSRDVSLSIWNPSGQLLRTMPIRKGSVSRNLSLDGLSSGIYLLRMEGNKGTVTQKLIVE